MTHGVGAVVIGRNEGARLIACLQSLIGRVDPLVYVDSGSTDGSPAAAEGLGAVLVSLDLAQPFTAARSRNAGFEALLKAAPQIRLVQFVDGDCELAPGWLDEAASLIDARPDVAVVCGRRRERHPGASVFNRVCDIEWDTPVGEAAACGGDFLVRAEAFAAAGGFRADLMAGEEPELCSRLRRSGWKIIRVAAEMTLHDAAMTRFGQWWRRGVRSGFGYAQVWSLTRRSAGALYGRELRRALIWAGLLPLAIVLAGIVDPVAGLAVAAIYPLQLVRIAARRGLGRPGSWHYGLLMIAAKFAELRGAAAYLRRPRRALIEYKRP